MISIFKNSCFICYRSDAIHNSPIELKTAFKILVDTLGIYDDENHKVFVPWSKSQNSNMPTFPCRVTSGVSIDLSRAPSPLSSLSCKREKRFPLANLPQIHYVGLFPVPTLQQGPLIKTYSVTSGGMGAGGTNAISEISFSLFFPHDSPSGMRGGSSE